MNKGLKYPKLIGMCVAALLPCLTLADAPSNAAAGQVEAILKFCAKSDPQLAKNVEAELTLVTGKLSPATRSSAQYRHEYDLVTDALAKVGKTQVVAACTAGLKPLDKDHDHGEGGGRR